MRTQEQIDADEALAIAIARCLGAYQPEEGNQFTLANYVVLTTMQQMTSDGIVITQYPMFMSNGDMPWYQILGLLEINSLNAKRDITIGRDNG